MLWNDDGISACVETRFFSSSPVDRKAPDTFVAVDAIVNCVFRVTIKKKRKLHKEKFKYTRTRQVGPEGIALCGRRWKPSKAEAEGAVENEPHNADAASHLGVLLLVEGLWLLCLLQ